VPSFGKQQLKGICFAVPPQSVYLDDCKGAIAEKLAVADMQTSGENRRKRKKLLLPLLKSSSVT